MAKARCWRRSAAIAPRAPIAVSLDLHANVTERMVRNCDAIAGYKTYPHVDQYESGQLAGSIVLRYLKGEVKPVMAWGNVPCSRRRCGRTRMRVR